jgi:hypothetical protein
MQKSLFLDSLKTIHKIFFIHFIETNGLANVNPEKVSFTTNMKKIRLAAPLALSIALHVFILAYSLNSLTPFALTSNQDISGDNIEDNFLVELAPVPEAPAHRVKQRFVESEESTLDIPADSRFLGKRDLSVAKQTRAPKVDDFTKGQSNKKSEASSGDFSSQSDSVASLDADEFGAVPSKPLSMRDLMLAGSQEGRSAATDDLLEGIPVGERTALNTRAHRYYAYYERAKHKLRIHWKPEVQRRAAKLSVEKRLVDGQQLVTRVVAYLDQEGNIQHVRTSQSSGFTYIDAAATTAFYKVKQIPNVPRGMVDSDGLARLHWEFVLNAAEAPSLKLADNNEEFKSTTRRID